MGAAVKNPGDHTCRQFSLPKSSCPKLCSQHLSEMLVYTKITNETVDDNEDSSIRLHLDTIPWLTVDICKLMKVHNL